MLSSPDREGILPLGRQDIWYTNFVANGRQLMANGRQFMAYGSQFMANGRQSLPYALQRK